MSSAIADALFAEHFGGSPTVRVSAPGRVNLIGEHTDYNGGFVLPIAIERRTYIAGSVHPTGSQCRLVTANQGTSEVVIFTASEGVLKPSTPAWANYVKGVLAQYMVAMPSGQMSCDIAIASDVPLGGGLSSSASLEVAVAAFLESAYGLRVDPKERALRCQKAEHVFANVPCGIMDQMISSCAVAGHALLIDCLPPFKTTPVPLKDDSVVFVVANSNVKHQLSGSEYPDRVRQCAAAAKILHNHFQKKAADEAQPLLRGATMAELVACKSKLSDTEFRRARHVISEDARTLDAVEAFRKLDYATAGRLMLESHASLRDDFEVSTKELDALVDIARRSDGVYGSRMTGGGFGGCTITLVKATAAEELVRKLEVEYERFSGRRPTCFVTKPSHGATMCTTGLSTMDDARREMFHCTSPDDPPAPQRPPGRRFVAARSDCRNRRGLGGGDTPQRLPHESRAAMTHQAMSSNCLVCSRSPTGQTGACLQGGGDQLIGTLEAEPCCCSAGSGHLRGNVAL